MILPASLVFFGIQALPLSPGALLIIRLQSPLSDVNFFVTSPFALTSMSIAGHWLRLRSVSVSRLWLLAYWPQLDFWGTNRISNDAR